MDKEEMDQDLDMEGSTSASTMSSMSSSASTSIGDINDWLIEPLSNCRISGRKRKMSDESSGSLSPLSTGGFSGHSGQLVARRSKPKLSKEAEEALKSYKNVFTNAILLTRILECLLDWDLRRIACVAPAWRDTCYSLLRKRIGNKPFILCWRTDAVVTPDDLTSKIHTHLAPNWLDGNVQDGLNPVTTIISFASSYLPFEQSDFSSVPAILGHRLSFVCASGCGVAVTLPGSHPACRVLQISSSSTFALQSLCIPFNPAFQLLNITIPTWSEDNRVRFLEALHGRYFVARNELVNTGKLLKWLLILQFFEDVLTNEFADSYFAGCGTPPGEIGIIVATVEQVISNTMEVGRNCISALIALHGLSTVHVATFGIHLGPYTIARIRSIAYEFFEPSINALVILVYRSIIPEESLADLKNVLGNIPLMGMATIQPIGFQGFYLGDLSGSPSTSAPSNWLSLQDSFTLDVDMALALIKY